MDGTASAEITRALAIARDLAKAGMPLFVAPPCPPDCPRPGHVNGSGTGGSGFDLPGRWQSSAADPAVVDRWAPGWALAAVCGYVFDALDVDPRNGGHVAEGELRAAGVWPRTYGRAVTPSGGIHDLIRSLGVKKGTPYPGVDLQAGDVHGDGRGFVFISPTVKRSKVDGQLYPYTWVTEPDLDALAEWGEADDSGAVIATALATVRERPMVLPTEPFDAADATDVRIKAYVDQALSREFAALRAAGPGGRNNAAFRCACALIELSNSPWAGVGQAALLAEFERVTALLDRPDDRFTPEEAHEAWTSAQKRVGASGRAYPARTTGGAFIPWEEWGGIPPFSSAGSALPGPATATAPDPFSSPQSSTQPVDNAVAAIADPVERLLACMLSPADLDRLPNPRWLVKGLLKLHSESWMIGPPGGFKSFVALDIAAHVAAGSAWQGLAVAGGPVVYLAAEGADGMKLRKQAWEAKYGTMSPAMRFIPFPVQAANAEHWSVLIAACQRVQPALIVLDTQARISVGLRENDATDMGLLIDAVSRLKRATGACVLVLHHTGRNSADARGSSALDGAQDTELKVERPKSRRSLRCTVGLDKQKDGSEAVKVALRLEVVDLGMDPDTGDDLSSLAVCPPDPFADPLGASAPEWFENLTENQGKIMGAMRDHSDESGATIPTLMTWLKQRDTAINRNSVDTAITSLIKKNLLERAGAKVVLTELID